MMEIPALFYFSLVNFGLFIVALMLLLRRPVQEYFRARAAALHQAVEDARRAETEALARAHAIENHLARLAETIEKLRAQTRAAGEAEQAEIVTRAVEFAQKIQKETERMVEQELRRMRITLRGKTVDLAILMAERLLREHMTPDDQGRLAKQFIHRLGSMH